MNYWVPLFITRDQIGDSLNRLLTDAQQNGTLQCLSEDPPGRGEPRWLGRAPIQLDFDDRGPLLFCNRPRQLFDHLAVVPNPTLAISDLSGAQRNRCHGKVFEFQGHFLEITRFNAHEDMGPPHDTLAHHLLQLTLTHRAPGAQPGSRPIQTEGVGKHPLFYDPLLFGGDADSVINLLNRMEGAQAPDDLVMLPPMRCEYEDTWFAPRYRRLRRAMDKVFLKTGPSLAVALWRLADRPAWRDLLLDGARLGHRRNTKLSEAVLFLPEQAAELPGAAWRRRLLKDPDAMPGDPAARLLWCRLADDIRGAVDAVVPAAGKGNWSDQAPRGYRNQGQRETGTFQKYRALADAWRDPDNTLSQAVLHPAAGPAGQPPDHDLADLLFLRRLWQTGDPDDETRRNLLLALLPAMLKRNFTLMDHLDEQAATWHWFIDYQPGEARVRYRDPCAVDLSFYQLLFPRGTCFQPGGTARLDAEPARLDQIHFTLG
ncbi:hypothetical protein [Acanthopleuribacter pedis]|uniref:Uncharacterized protein n=1 Tax=Acanthopleuribacter pedis TaxID=442870 RepID=A0A8J7QCV3_9BACT|nr:hypothetical protein [Acanthopleuribacter pedis]MBO1321439.1 hypothetical protein [Acanthopleuribacter pedis]